MIRILPTYNIFKGGPGSGNYGHSGRPGRQGGSGQGGGSGGNHLELLSSKEEGSLVTTNELGEVILERKNIPDSVLKDSQKVKDYEDIIQWTEREDPKELRDAYISSLKKEGGYTSDEKLAMRIDNLAASQKIDKGVELYRGVAFKTEEEYSNFSAWVVSSGELRLDAPGSFSKSIKVASTFSEDGPRGARVFLTSSGELRGVDVSPLSFKHDEKEVLLAARQSFTVTKVRYDTGKKNTSRRMDIWVEE